MACTHALYLCGDGNNPPEEGCTHPDHDGLECEDCIDRLDLEDLKSVSWDQKTHEVTEG